MPPKQRRIVSKTRYNFELVTVVKQVRVKSYIPKHQTATCLIKLAIHVTRWKPDRPPQCAHVCSDAAAAPARAFLGRSFASSRRTASCTPDHGSYSTAAQPRSSSV